MDQGCPNAVRASRLWCCFPAAPAHTVLLLGHRAQNVPRPFPAARFQQAVEQSGGIMAATPRAILDALTMEGVTYAQVKSHLQRYRTAHIAELLERGEEVGDASEAQLRWAGRRRQRCCQASVSPAAAAAPRLAACAVPAANHPWRRGTLQGSTRAVGEEAVCWTAPASR